MAQITDTGTTALLACEEGFDPIEDRLRANIRGTIEAVFDEELDGFLGRLRYGRTAGAVKGYRHGNRDRQIVGTFGTETISVPRARIEDEAGRVSEWRSKALPRYQRLTKTAGALIASVYLAGTNTRRVKCALFALFKGAVSKDVVSRAWRKVKVDWDAWCARSLADEDVIRLILDGTVIKTRLDRKATNISVLAAIGVRRDGQKVLLSIMNMGGESTAAWRQFLDDLDKRGLKRPQFVIRFCPGEARFEAHLLFAGVGNGVSHVYGDHLATIRAHHPDADQTARSARISASTAATAVMLTMRRMVAEGVNTWADFESPIRIGPRPTPSVIARVML
jgi:transposase-like protein